VLVQFHLSLSVICLGKAKANTARFQLYKAVLEGRTYFGCTGLELPQRCENMKLRPVLWLKGHPGLGRLVLEPLGRRVTLEKCLALEAAATALAWEDDEAVVRGGPWCLQRLDKTSRSEIKVLAAALRGVRGAGEKVEAVQDVARQCRKDGALCRHLRQECFRCGLQLLLCRCRSLRRRDEGLALAVKRRSGKVSQEHADGCAEDGGGQRFRQVGGFAGWGGDSALPPTFSGVVCVI
jgi:hypothetical protein